MRLTYVIDSLAYGGAEHSLVALLHSFADLKIDITVTCLFRREGDMVEQAAAAGAKVLVAPAASAFRQALWLRRHLLSTSPDILHTTLWRSDVVGRLASVGLDIQVVTSLVSAKEDGVRSTESGIARWKLAVTQLIDRWTGRWLTDHYHAVSRAVRDSASRRLGVAPGKVTVIRRGRDPELFCPPSPSDRLATCTELGVPAGHRLVLHVGRQEPAKGLTYLIHAFALVLREAPSTTLLLVGAPGSSTTAVLELIAEFKLQDRVRVLGRRSDVDRLLGAADVLVLPSLWEGLPNVVIEAMATGTAVVASDIPAVRDAVEPDNSALLAPPADVDVLRTQILTLLDDGDLRARLGTRGREIFLECFTVEKVAKEMKHLYEAVIATGGVPPDTGGECGGRE